MNTPRKKSKARASVANVAVVENSLADVRLISEMLAEAGHGQIVLKATFRKLQEAIGQIAESPDVFDAVLLDLALPDCRGIESFRRLAAAAPQMPIIVLSGSDDEELANLTVQEGAQDYLAKSDLSGRVLVRAIAHAIERKRSEMELSAARDEMEARVKERTVELEQLNGQLAEALNQLGEAQSRMIQQERLHALERMASGIAHDFNNALSPILAHTEWLLMKPSAMSDEEKLKQTLIKIHEQAAHCAEVVSRLREFYRSRDEISEFKPLSLRRAVEEAVSLTQPCWKDQAQARGVDIRVELEFEKTPKVQGDNAELRELFTNLLLNAIDAIKQNGVIKATVFEEDGRVCVRIGDNGVGMTEEIGARCMEPFFTTKHGLGSGLGLGVVYGIAQRHDAEIDIESEIGVGTDITVRFPAYDPNQAAPDEMPPLLGLRILVAEDEAMIREVVGIYLGEDAHRVQMAVNGSEALKKLKADRFDLLITDHSMPEISGERLAREARKLDPKLRILLLTGFGNLYPPGAGIQPHIDVVVPKPFTFKSLRQGISSAMATLK